ncbi:MAG: 1,4-dihydroxy-2-naphthoate octaprenyltransferase [Candidatus Dichloromethanomonas elyunquensis]|nr:MAG: 1,4-dihydroxy-2-naphthoate octaprenyltransferase [Candidatus Dichloromethanomonas elyunquensis]
MHTNSTLPELSIFKIWYLAIRPKTLPAAAGPVIVGLGLALGNGSFRLGPGLAALLAALLLQIGSNLANDVYDFKKGTDTQERLGPIRVTQAGLLSPKQVIMGMIFVFAFSALAGVYLIVVGGWPILVIGILAIVCAIAYTAGPYPLGYKGIADVFVFVFFGPVAVCGTYYLQAGNIPTAAWWSSIPPGLLVTAILVINNLRDIETDRRAGKKTLAVRFGVKFTQAQYLMLVSGAYLIPLLMWFMGISPLSVLLSWFSLPLLVPRVKDILTKKGVRLNTTLAGTAFLGLIFCILFSIGYLMG